MKRRRKHKRFSHDTRRMRIRERFSDRKPVVESLEQRLLLSTSLHNGLLWYYGTSGNDLVEITAGEVPGEIQINDTTFSGVHKIILKTGPGDDRIMMDHDLLNPKGKFITTRIHVQGGNDYVEGGSGRDRIFGGKGDDWLSGRDGHDLIKGAHGEDRILGGGGNDRLDGRKGNDTIYGNNGKDVLRGRGGQDILSGGDGDDKVSGGRDDDQLSGGAGNDTIKGSWGNDTINGGDGINHLIAGSGTDLIYGRSGIDVLRMDRHDQLIEEGGPRLIQRLNSDSELNEWLIEQGLKRWNSLTGEIAFANPWLRGDPFLGIDQDTQPQSITDTQSNFTDTNVQVHGVDEADLVKTNGNSIYVLSENQVVSVEIDDLGMMQISGRTPIQGQAKSMFLHDSRLTVFSQIYNSYPYPIDDVLRPQFGVADARISPYFFKPQFQVTAFDITDERLDESDLIYKTVIDGRIADTRAIDDHLYVVVQNHFNLIRPRYTLNQTTGERIYESQEEYTQHVRDAELDDFLPGYTTTVVTPDEDQEISGSLVNTPDIYVPKISDQTHLTTVVVFDTNGNSGPVSTTSVVGTGEDIFCSLENLYIGSARWWGSWGQGQRTTIYQFSIDRENVALVATGDVEGRVLNQFSMDESRDGHFRIATTSSAGAPENFVFIMERNGDLLDVIGSINGIGKGETIQSVRFLGDRAHVVTFRIIDPLFSIDLSDPKNPNITGELKVPGFSTYLHPISDEMLAGFGRYADESTGQSQGLQLSLFDISDPVAPRLAASHLFPGKSHQWSEALHDHHAFSYYPGYEILALPVATGSWWWDRSTSGLAVFELDTGTDASITPATVIEHESQVRRSLRINQTLYSISDQAIKAHMMSDLHLQVDELLLHEEDF